jgi:hypothetical protein
MTFGKDIAYLSRKLEVTFTTVWVIIFDVFCTKFLNSISPRILWFALLKNLISFIIVRVISGRKAYLLNGSL